MAVGTRNIHPLPREEHYFEGFHIFSGEIVFRAGSGLPDDVAELFSELLGNFTTQKCTLRIVSDGSLPPFCACTENASARLPDNGDDYCVSVAESGVSLGAATLSGLRYAYYTFLQLLQRRGDETITGYASPNCFITDAPALSFRGIHLCLFPDTDLSLIEKYLTLAAFTKYNYAVIEPWGALALDSFPAWRDKRFTKDEIRPIVKKARLMGLEIIPQVNCLGHASAGRDVMGKNTTLEVSPELAPLLEPDGYDWCISNPALRPFLKKVRLELYDLFGPSGYIHIGGDEAYFLASCDRCKEHPFLPLVADYLNGIAEEIAEEGRRPMMWSDMLLDPSDWQGGEFIAANSSPERPTHRLLDTLDRRFVITDWQYDIVKERDRTAKSFTQKGFSTILCPFCKAGNVEALAASAKEEEIDGVLLTTWSRQKRLFHLVTTEASLLWHKEATSFIQPTILTTELLRKLCPSGGYYTKAGWLNGTSELAD